MSENAKPFEQKERRANRALLAAAKQVLKGLNARIDNADPRHVPVFDGIAELHTAIGRVDRLRTAIAKGGAQ